MQSAMVPTAFEAARRGWSLRAAPTGRAFTVWTGDGAARDAGERGHAEVDGLLAALQGGFDLGELVLGAGEADLKALDLAEPALALGLP